MPLPRILIACVLSVALGAAVPAAAQTAPIAPAGSPAAQINTLLKAGKLNDALLMAEARLKENPRDAQVRFLRGVILTEQDKPVEASAVFEAMTQEFPELPEPYNNLAVIAANQGKYQQALGLLQQAVAAAPNYVTAYENMGDVYVSLAAQSYQRVLDLGTNSANVRSKLQLTRELSERLRAVR